MGKKKKTEKPDFEMTDEQKELFDALTTLQQQVSLNSLSGMSDIDSYRNSNGKAKTESAQRAGVAEILANPNVVAFLDSMKAIKVNEAVMSRQEMLEELSVLARTNVDDLIEFGYRPVETLNEETGETEVQMQSYWTMREMSKIDQKHMKALEEVSVGKDGLKFKKVSKLTAMKQLAEMEGYNAASKHEHSSPDGTMSPTGKSLDDFYKEAGN